MTKICVETSNRLFHTSHDSQGPIDWLKKETSDVLGVWLDQICANVLGGRTSHISNCSSSGSRNPLQQPATRGNMCV